LVMKKAFSLVYPWVMRLGRSLIASLILEESQEKLTVALA